MRVNVRFFSSNITDLSSEEIYKDIYVKRGESSENRIKEVKNMCFSDRLSCHRYFANFMRLVISSLAYEFMRLLREYIRKTTLKNAHKWQVNNMRLYLLKVGDSIRLTVRRVTINFSKSYICADLFTELNNEI